MDGLFKKAIITGAILGVLSGWYQDYREVTSHLKEDDIVQSDSCNAPYILKIKSLPLDSRWPKAQLDSLDQLALELDEDLCDESLYLRTRALIRNVPEPSPALCWAFYTHYVNERLQNCDNHMYRQMLNAYEDWSMSAKICYPQFVTTNEEKKRYEETFNLLLFETFCGLLDGESRFRNWLDLSNETEKFRELNKNISIDDFSTSNIESTKLYWDRLVNLASVYRDLQLSENFHQKDCLEGIIDKQRIHTKPNRG